MRSPLRPARWSRPLLALALVAGGCAGVGDQVAELRSRAGDAADQVQFCFAVTRALTAVDGGSSPSQARTAAEEVLARVPDELRADAELVADRLREAADRRDTVPLDGDFEDAARRLRDGTQELCDPRS